MNSGGTFQLVIRRGPQPGEIFPISGTVMTIGRDARNDIVINDPEVSRQHAQLSLQAQGYLITDQGSTNGTFVNGTRLTAPYRLTDGDEVGLGETVVLGYRVAAPEAIATVMGPQVEFEEFEPAEESSSLPFEFDSAEPDLIPPLPFDDSPMPASGPAPAPPPPFPSEAVPQASFKSEPRQVPPARYSPEPKLEPVPVPAPRTAAERRADAPSPPPTAAYSAAPVPYPPAVEVEEEKPAKRNVWLIGCGCLALLAVCSAVGYFGYRFGTAVWNAPAEFWQNPINNWHMLQLISAPLLPFLI